MQDEKDIINRVLSGDTDSFRLIVEQYQGLVFSICYNMVKDRFEAENLTQDTFIKAYDSLSTYEFKGFKTWISRIAINKCLDFKRRSFRHKEKLVAVDDLPDDINTFQPLVEELVIMEEEASAIRKVCDSLPDIYRQVITEYFINSKGVRQIADEGGLNIKTVETRLYRGIKMFGRKWKEGYG